MAGGTTESIIWKSLNDIDEKHTEPAIIDGRVVMTIDGQYRLLKMNQYFGDCGKNWGWRVIEHWSEKFGTATTVFVMLKVWYIVGDTQYEIGEQIGGTEVVKGDPGNACKSAITDAIGKSLAAIGLGADIYLGLMDEKATLAMKANPPAAPEPKAESKSVTKRKEAQNAVVAPSSIEPLPNQESLPFNEPVVGQTAAAPAPKPVAIQPVQSVAPVVQAQPEAPKKPTEELPF